MRLVKKIGKQGLLYWLNEETRQEYGRTAIGLVFPGKRPGYIVALGEDDLKDPARQVTHYHVIAEAEESSLEAFFNRLHELSGLLAIVDLYGNTNDRVATEFLNRFNSALHVKRQPGLTVSSPPMLGKPDCFEFSVRTILGHTTPGAKTLHIGPDSWLSAYLLELRHTNIKATKPEDFPAVAALGFALTSMTVWPARDPFEKEAPTMQQTDYNIFTALE